MIGRTGLLIGGIVLIASGCSGGGGGGGSNVKLVDVSDVTCSSGDSECTAAVTVEVTTEPTDGDIDVELAIDGTDISLWDWMGIGQQSGEFVVNIADIYTGACTAGDVDAELFIDVLDDANCGGDGDDPCKSLGQIETTREVALICN